MAQVLRKRASVKEWLAGVRERVGPDAHAAVFFCGPDALKADVWEYCHQHWHNAHLRLETFDMLPREAVSFFACPMSRNNAF